MLPCLTLVVAVAQSSPFHPIPPAPSLATPVVTLPPPAANEHPPPARRGEQHIAFTAHIAPDGRVAFDDDELYFYGYGTAGGIPMPGLGAGFDITDIIMRRLGVDPYQYEKARYMERTFERRAEMRRHYGRVLMARALSDLPRYLDALWQQPGWSYRLRRRVLFELWDECAERGSEELIAGGRDARAIIEGFIRQAIPAGSPCAYTADELSALNAERQSEAVFAPYGAETDPPGDLLACAP